MKGDCIKYRQQSCVRYNKRNLATYLLVQLDTLHDLQGQCEIAKQTVYPQKTNKREVSEHTIERTRAVFPDDLTKTRVQYASLGLSRAGVENILDLLLALSLLQSGNMLVNPGLLDERVQDVQYTVRTPDLQKPTD